MLSYDKKHFLHYSIITLLLAIVIYSWGQALLIYSKAQFAKVLISYAWQQTLKFGAPVKPWSWADTRPVAKIQFNNTDTFFVLAGSAGNSLAFGPGHTSATALPGTRGTSVIGGHRDTHFALLKHIQQGDIINVQNIQGEWKNYAVQDFWVADIKQDTLLIDNSQNTLLLITCYPFNSIIPGGTQRFVVSAAEF